MQDKSKERESKADIDARSIKILDLFKAIKGKPLQDFPVPPLTKWLNGKIISAERGDVVIQLTVRPEMANPTGLLHGGMMAAICDDAIGMTSATLGNKGFLISVDMNINYLGKVKVGEEITARGHISREGRNIIHGIAELKDKDGNLVATASSNLLLTTHEPDYAKQLL
jgi:uncharacterized protein (TIGR00369 family)